MFPNKESMEISSVIMGHWQELLHNFSIFHNHAILRANGEVQYFRYFFNDLSIYLNSISFSGINFDCQTVEIHQKPIVSFHPGKRCELGDYFVSVKYVDGNGRLLGKKLVIYQFKMGRNNKFKIDQVQLELLRNWPTFTFGRRNFGVNTYNLRPKTPDLGSYWLALRENSDYSFAASATDIYNYQVSNKIGFNELNKIILTGQVALLLQLGWRYGEYVQENSDMNDFFDTLYRYVGFDPDPPDEFIGFMTDKNSDESFWGIEVKIKLDNK